MLHVGNIFQAVKSALHGRPEIHFRKFLLRSHVTKWAVSADFVVQGKNSLHDVFAFTIFPYDADLLTLMAEADAASKHDLKHVKSVNEDMLEYIGQQRRFSLCFIANSCRYGMANPGRWQAALDADISLMQSWKDAGEHQSIIKKFLALREKAKSGSFNFELFMDIILLGGLSATLIALIAKHSAAEFVMLMPDRDKMTQAYGGIFTEIVALAFSGICQSEGLSERTTRWGLCGPPSDAGSGEALWYDALIRVPDFLAGTIARWNLPSSTIESDKAKFTQIIEQSIGDNPNIIIVRLHISILAITSSVYYVNLITKLPHRAGFGVDGQDVIEYAVKICLGTLKYRRSTRREALNTSVFRLLTTSPYLPWAVIEASKA